MKVRDAFAKEDTSLAGLYEGQPTRTTTRPTGLACMTSVCPRGDYLGVITIEDLNDVNLSPLPGLVVTILTYWGLSASLYTRLIQHPS